MSKPVRGDCRYNPGAGEAGLHYEGSKRMTATEAVVRSRTLAALWFELQQLCHLWHIH